MAIDFANNHLDEVNRMLQKTAIDLKYKYYNINRLADIQLSAHEDTWSNINIVSINEGKVVGLIKVKFSNPYKSAELSIMSTGDYIFFITDVSEVIRMLFGVYKTPRISFMVLIGNPVENFYDKMIVNLNGRIWGHSKKSALAMDGEICDMKHYEIILEDYLQSKYYQKVKEENLSGH